MDNVKQLDDLHETLASTESELRDAREALARVEAERDDIAKSRDQAIADWNQAVDQRDAAQAQLVEAAHLLERATSVVETEPLASDIVGFLSKHEDRHAQAEQQEAQGAQAGDEAKSFEAWWTSTPILRKNKMVLAQEAWMARAALATQPAAGEPEQQTAINADDLPTKKYPLGAFDFDAPVAAGEPLTGKRLYGMYTGPSEYQHDKWRVVTDQHADWNRLADRLSAMMAAPPAAAHGDELVAVVGTVPYGSGFKSLDFKVALESLPDGTRLYAAHGDEAVLPERRPSTNGAWNEFDSYSAGWNDCLDRVAELRAQAGEGGA